MKRDDSCVRNRNFFLILAFALLATVLFPQVAKPENDILIDIIIVYNRRTLEESFLDGSNRGEDGILMMRPDVGKSLGMQVFMDQSYLEAKEFYEEADKALEAAEKALFSEKNENVAGEHVQAVADHFLAYKKMTEMAEQKIKLYRSKLEGAVDDRLQDVPSVRVMDRLLSEAFRKNENRLRDALGLFYNICRGVNKNSPALTPENITFVNEVYDQFLQLAPDAALKKFDLEKVEDEGDWGSPTSWRLIVGKQGARFVPFVEAAAKKHNNGKYAVDPLLFMALMRRESAFNHLAVSPVGAAGLTQIMPDTGKGLGMKHIFKPDYFEKAVSMAVAERRNRRQAHQVLEHITVENSLSKAKKARKLAKKALDYNRKKVRLFARYKNEMLKKRKDDRLVPAHAIEHGFKYFAGLLKAQKGDVSLALASYNAGPNAVRKYRGIPPYQETVLFRNRVLQFYRQYTADREKIVSQ
jgi:soluble lytic murein transglycosylase-like protein